MHGQVAHVLRTRSPLGTPRRENPVRLACVKRAASVRPEPGSNSPLEISIRSIGTNVVTLVRKFVLTVPVLRHAEDTMPPGRRLAGLCHGTPCSSTPQHPDCQTSRGPLVRFSKRQSTGFTRSAARRPPSFSEPFNLTPPAPSVNPSGSLSFSTSFGRCRRLTLSI